MSKEQLHRLVFRGDILIGFDKAKARANLGRLLRVTDTRRMALLFSGKPVVIKKNLTAHQVEKYQVTLEKSGILVSVEPPLVVREKESSPAFAIDEEALEAIDKAASERQSEWRRPAARARASNPTDFAPARARPKKSSVSAPTISASFTGLSFSPVQGTRPRPQPQPEPAPKAEPKVEPETPPPSLSAERTEPLPPDEQMSETISPQSEKKASKGLQWGIAGVLLVAAGIGGWLAWNFYTNTPMLPEESATIVEEIKIPQLSEFERSLENIEDPALREELRQLQAELQRLDQDIQ